MDQMNVQIRNTFVHLSNHTEDVDENSPKARSSSAPPSTCRNMKSAAKDCDLISTSTRCKTYSTVTSSCPFDEEVSQPAEDGWSTCASAARGDEARKTSACEHAEEQIEDMSRRVMDIWSRLRSVETHDSSVAPCASSSCHSSAGTQPITAHLPQFTGIHGEHPAAISTNWAWMPMQSQSQVVPMHVGASASVTEPTSPTSPTGGTRTSLRSLAKNKGLDAKAPLFTPSCKANGDKVDFVASVKQLLLLLQGVASVDVQSGTSEGTLTTITIKVRPEVTTVESVIASTKLVFLETAANSESVYVMGYEAEPFKEVDGSGFASMLGSMPTAWQHSACWDTYQLGCCPRGKHCKWQHPGKRELQPVRVVVS